VSGPLLIADTSAATATLALGRPGEPVFERALPQRQTSEKLLAAIDELLRAADLDISDLDGVAAVRGPGSFTGLRIGLATAYGIHQATGIRAGTITTLEAFGAVHESKSPAAAIVDALRGEWFVQTFTDGTPCGPVETPRILTTAALQELAVDSWIGFSAPDMPTERAIELHTPEHLARELLTALRPERGSTARNTATVLWDASTLLEPCYLRAPAITLPRSAT